MDKRLVLFDLDGTLVDSVSAIIDTINEVAVLEGYKQIASREEIRKFSSIELLRFIGVPVYKFPFLMRTYRSCFLKRISRLHIYPDLMPVIESLSLRAVLGVISSNDTDVINTILKNQGVDGLFTHIKGGSFFTKSRHINKIRKLEGLAKERVVYVGDETRDIMAARRAGVISCAVTWGMQSEEVLLHAKPHMIAATPKELNTLLLSWCDGALTKGFL